MTVTIDSPTRAPEAEYELELLTQRWEWTPSLYGLLGVSDSIKPRADLIVLSKHPDDRPITRRVIEDGIAQRRSFCYQSRVVRGDGQLRTLEATGKTVLAPDGSPLAMVGTVASVSDWQAPVLEELRTGPVSEGHLAVALLARVTEAHAYVFRRYASVVAQACQSVLRGSAQIDDVVQLVFETLWLHPARFDPERGSLATYLRLQARGRSIDVARSESKRLQRAQRADLGSASVSGAEDEFVATISNSQLRRALTLLPSAEREPIELAYLGSMSYQMVAAHLRVPEGTIKSRIRSGLSRLRDLVDVE